MFYTLDALPVNCSVPPEVHERDKKHAVFTMKHETQRTNH